MAFGALERPIDSLRQTEKDQSDGSEAQIRQNISWRGYVKGLLKMLSFYAWKRVESHQPSMIFQVHLRGES